MKTNIIWIFQWIMYRYGQTIVFILLAVFLLMVVLFYLNFLIPFNQRTKYIKMEIKRAPEQERQFWKRQLVGHYIRNIPFVGQLVWRSIEKRRVSRMEDNSVD